MNRLLLIEDEPSLVLGLRDRLESEGYDVTVAEDGETGWTEASGGGFDLVLLDLMLPRLPGREILARMRGARDATPVVVLTARTREEEKVDLLDLGADDYVVKPFGAAELLARIRAVLRRVPEPEPARASIGDAEIDLAGHRIRLNGEDRPLTPLEAQVLGIFLRARGRVVTRAEILREIWGVEVEVETRTVDFHVMRLRRLIEENPGQPRHLTTVHGAGYRLENI
jgi:DNA-binding response OmpR family regulator